ncbi:MAG TPA: response regulator transcription factor [Vicinamibacterales bacterium]|jgi:DNA-binding NarL/FixJ family response regulator|nr:response regulator transcription factor [Vicinamibacterales bacterium]
MTSVQHNVSDQARQQPLAVVIIEDVRDVREGLAILINGSPGFRCTRSFRTMEEALRGVTDARPHVVLTDLGLPGMSGVEGIRLLQERVPSVPILALTVHDSDDKVFAALCAGASGYLLKNTPPARLLESLREVAAGGAPMSPEIARRVLALFRDFRPASHASYHLTPQENELLKLLVDGHHKKTAAQAMGISVNTVSFHLKNIYGKLQVHSKTEAVAKALRERLV